MYLMLRIPPKISFCNSTISGEITVGSGGKEGNSFLSCVRQMFVAYKKLSYKLKGPIKLSLKATLLFFFLFFFQYLVECVFLNIMTKYQTVILCTRFIYSLFVISNRLPAVVFSSVTYVVRKYQSLWLFHQCLNSTLRCLTYYRQQLIYGVAFGRVLTSPPPPQPRSERRQASLK